MAKEPTSVTVLQRMPIYLRALREMNSEGISNVSSVGLADRTGLNCSVVKKDLSLAISNVGKPKIGYSVGSLIDDIENYMGINNAKDAVLVGAGKLGQALLGYEGFANFGLNIVAGFDTDDALVNREYHGKKILPTGKMQGVIERLKIKIAVLTVPSRYAQVMTDCLVSAGIRAIWNFTPVQLAAPDTVAVKNENLAASLAVLSKQLKELLDKENQ